MFRRYLWEAEKILVLLVVASPFICCVGFTLALVLLPHRRDLSLAVQLSIVVAQMLFILWLIRTVVRQLDALDRRMLPAATKIRHGIAAELNQLSWFRSIDSAHPALKWLKWSVTGKVVAIEGDRTWSRDLDYATRCADPGNNAK